MALDSQGGTPLARFLPSTVPGQLHRQKTLPCRDAIRIAPGRRRASSGGHGWRIGRRKATLKLPHGIIPAGIDQTDDDVRQPDLNTTVMGWELLEKELPAHADDPEMNRQSSGLGPDLRELKAMV